MLFLLPLQIGRRGTAGQKYRNTANTAPYQEKDRLLMPHHRQHLFFYISFFFLSPYRIHSVTMAHSTELLTQRKFRIVIAVNLILPFTPRTFLRVGRSRIQVPVLRHKLTPDPNDGLFREYSARNKNFSSLIRSIIFLSPGLSPTGVHPRELKNFYLQDGIRSTPRPSKWETIYSISETYCEKLLSN